MDTQKADVKMRPYPTFTERIYEQENVIYFFLKLFCNCLSLHFPINMLKLTLENNVIGHTNIRIYFINTN